MLLGVPFEQKLKIILFLVVMLIISLAIEKVQESKKR